MPPVFTGCFLRGADLGFNYSCACHSAFAFLNMSVTAKRLYGFVLRERLSTLFTKQSLVTPEQPFRNPDGNHNFGI